MFGKLKKGVKDIKKAAKDRGDKFMTESKDIQAKADLVKVFNEGTFHKYIKDDNDYKDLLIDLTNKFCGGSEKSGDDKNNITNDNRKAVTKEATAVKGVADMKDCVENYRLLGEPKGATLLLLKYIDNPDLSLKGGEFLKNTLLHPDSLKKMPSALKDTLQKSFKTFNGSNYDLSSLTPDNFSKKCKEIEDKFKSAASYKTEGVPLTVKEQMYIELENVIKVKKKQKAEIQGKKDEIKEEHRKNRKGTRFLWIVIGCISCAVALTPKDYQSDRGGILRGRYSSA